MAKFEHVDFYNCYDEHIAQHIVDHIATLNLTNAQAYATVAAVLAGQLASNPDKESREAIMRETRTFMREYIDTARSLGGEFITRGPQP